jgi:hypothetical protein
MKEIKKAVINLKNKIERMAESIDSDVEKIIMLIEKKEMENEKPLCGGNRKEVVQADKRHDGRSQNSAGGKNAKSR